MNVLQIRWKLACYTTLCLMFLAAACKVGQPVSFANVFGGFCIVLLTCSALVLMWAWLKLPGLMKVSTAAVPEDIACKRRDEPYGPAFPLGRYDEMCLRAGSRTGAAETGNPLTLCVPLRDAGQVLQLGELVYQSMWQSALDYSACKDQSRSSDAAAEAMDFLLLRTVQEALAGLYERATSQKAEEIECFRLPEQNIARQVR